VDCPSHEKDEIKCPRNKNDFTICGQTNTRSTNGVNPVYPLSNFDCGGTCVH